MQNENFINQKPVHTILQGILKSIAPDKRGIEDNSKIIFLISSMKTYVLTPHNNRLGETVLMMGHIICFNGKIWIIIPKLFLLPLLIWSTERGSLSLT